MRNTESHFAMLPKINMQRSKFKRDSDTKTAFNAGKLIPVYLDEVVLPGDTHSMKTTLSIRMSTPIHPTMDDAFLDLYYFFVPYRLVWDDFEAWIGDNNGEYWEQARTDIQMPHLLPNSIYAPTPDTALGSLYDYMGYPLYEVPSSGADFSNCSVSALPFRAYALIWNEWFRSEVTDIPCLIQKDSTDRNLAAAISSITNYVQTASRGGVPCPVSKFHDYFTSALLSPQRGPDVLLPMSGEAPVIPSAINNDINLFQSNAINLGFTDGNPVPTSDTYLIGSATSNVGNTSNTAVASLFSNTQGEESPVVPVVPLNLKADLSLATSSTINQLREALALQSFYEKNARYGTRYTEILRGHFGVISPDSRLQRPEYIGGKRVRLNMQQVLQTSSTDTTSPQGNTSAFSWTVDSSDSFTYSASEHGLILGLACVRTAQTYQYGISRQARVRDAIDLYWESFAHVGEQPVYNYEIYAQGTAADGEIFGYQEYAADYRYKPSRITGVLRSNAPQSLDVWHYAEKYDSLPTLSSEWMHQSANVIDRTLAVTSDLQPQFIADFDFNCVSVRPMPMHSIPGLGYHF